MTLKEARDIAGLTQQELANRSGLTQTTIYDLESGRNKKPSHETVVRVVRALQRSGLAGVTAEQLFPIAEESDRVTT